MTPERVEMDHWRGSRWWLIVGLVFIVQIGLIFWLGKPQRPARFLNKVAPSLQLVGPGAAEVLALNDPTLFALPHWESFSGVAWLTIPDQDYPPFAWSEPPRWLTLEQSYLGADFEAFMSTNRLDILPALAQPELQFKVPVVVESNPFPAQSTLKLTGALAGRTLLVSPALPSWPSAEILTNSVVQILVGPDGRSVSTVLLKSPGNAPNEADQFALREARKARFEPLALADPLSPLAGLSWGQMVFQWHTLPLPATNSLPETGREPPLQK